MKFIKKILLAFVYEYMPPNRIGRIEFITRNIICSVSLFAVYAIFLLPLYLLEDIASDFGAYSLVLSIPAMILVIATIFMCYIAIKNQISRLHDSDLSGWWVIGLFFLDMIPIIGPIIGLYILFFRRGTQGNNRFGPPPAKVGRNKLPMPTTA